jgi:hypothetical protein
MSSRSISTRPGVALAIACACVALAPALASAQGLERLVMPGPLTAAHAKLEASCASCHRAFQKGAQTELCLECHDHAPIAADRAQRAGFHGRGAARESACSSCHGEHEGRTADIVRLDPQTFAHDATDFPLAGRHRTAACASCHETGKPHRDAAQDCVSCHRNDDAHAGTLGKKCADCHDENAWQRTRFDHGKTRFPLLGKHEKVACAGCHPTERYRDAPEDCASCHRLHDVHGGDFGPKCQECHDPRGWQRISFDHARDTRFPLRGAHAPLACASCHQGNPYAVRLQTACISCHRSDDEHKGRFGERCEGCHTSERWKAETFDHDGTKFPLRGRHARASCVGCHRGVPEQEDLPTACQGCHAKDDVHSGQQGKNCATCHGESGWKAEIRFEHDLTRFPLLGLHAVAPCEECHASARFQDAETACSECHRDDDFHERTLGTACERCHNPNGWTFWRFDHADTDFPLQGKHAEQGCRACHSAPVVGEVRQSSSCDACHEGDDAHFGSYGRDCGRCHAPTAWSAVKTVR